ncbi:DUF7115 domain-containing protein [Halorubrum lacusprofundi]|uniref:DUF7115 domain-containing protein n=1 Tax=Halorubrum lacusprofundi (strain ATCC 49239 / DSM 5036 / JCM 8891 / ACAM 34) TaxID=416348 RepID=B9LRT3_HALLT|nr:hypothetical protein [Halorubrum lacusprofundi]ACM57807.1 conserved hypothetical protein [Halorubrum lacusprofundi ATCC 49239]MCG1007038.1 hypothetical protein [Halorubrum lacusprofundi]
MSLPELLAGTVGDEEVVAEVPLGGADRLAVTPTRTLVYRGDGLLSDESVAEYSHDVERIAVSTGRRKAKLTLGYGLNGDETISVPTKRADDVLHPVLAGVLSATGVTDPGESVIQTFRFSELTLVVTSERLVKHVGSAVWDEEFEEFAYADITDLDFEEGTVATAVVLTHGGRSERFKAPNESARAVRETLVDAVCAYHGVDSLEEFRVTVADQGDDDSGGVAAGDDGGSTTDFGEGPDPLSASPVADAEAEAEAGTEGESAPNAESGGETMANERLTRGGGSASSVAEDTETAPNAESVKEPVDGHAVDANDPLSDDPLADDPLSDDQNADPASGRAVDADPTARSETDFASDATGEATGEEIAPTDATESQDTTAPADHVDHADPVDADAFDGSPFESAGVEGEDLATEVAELRHTVEQQSERLDRQSALIEQLIEELRRGR